VFATDYYAPPYFAPDYFGQGDEDDPSPEGNGGYFAGDYFAPDYFSDDYFGTGGGDAPDPGDLETGGTFRRSLWSLARVWRYRAVPVNRINPVSTLTKTESDARLYLFDLSRAPEVVAGATCASGVVVGTTTGLTVGTPAVLDAEADGIAAGEGVSVRISGGEDDTTYRFALNVTLSTGDVVSVPARLVVVSDDGS
jgi:hypothetical protein